MVSLEGRSPTLRIILVLEPSLSSWVVYPLLRDPSSPYCRGCPRQAQYLRSAIWAILTKLDPNLESQHRSPETLLPLPLAIQAKLLLQESEHLNIHLPLPKPQILLLFGH